MTRVAEVGFAAWLGVVPSTPLRAGSLTIETGEGKRRGFHLKTFVRSKPHLAPLFTGREAASLLIAIRPCGPKSASRHNGKPPSTKPQDKLHLREVSEIFPGRGGIVFASRAT